MNDHFEPQFPFDGYEQSEYAALSDFITREEAPTAALVHHWITSNLRPKSVIDIGTSSGVYLRPFAEDGCEVLGVDALEGGGALLPEATTQYQRFDLRWPFKPSRLYDIAIFTEVGEHLEHYWHERLIDSVCACSDTVLMSWAAPGLPGILHKGCLDNGTVLRMFARRGFREHALNAHWSQYIQGSSAVQWIKNAMLLQRMPINRLPRLYDCFLFNDEIDVLEVRLETLWDSVDVFVLVESPFDFRGNPKPMHFLANARRFEKYMDKLRHVTAAACPYTTPQVGEMWGNEGYQRNAVAVALDDALPDDVIMVSDVDEIPDPDNFRLLRRDGTITKIECRAHFYNFNWIDPTLCACGTHIGAVTFREFTSGCDLKAPHGDFCIYNGGWHLSWFGSDSYAKHSWYPHPLAPNHAEARLVPTVRKPLVYIGKPTLPTYVERNRDRFAHFFDSRQTNHIDVEFSPVSFGIGDILHYASIIPFLQQDGYEITAWLPDLPHAVVLDNYPGVEIVKGRTAPHHSYKVIDAYPIARGFATFNLDVTQRRLFYFPTEDELEWTRSQWMGVGLRVCVQTNGSTPDKNLPQIREAAEQLVHDGHDVVFLDDYKAMPIRNALAMMASADIAVGLDSGPTWAAMGAGVPTVMVTLPQTRSDYMQHIASPSYRYIHSPHAKVVSSGDIVTTIRELMQNA